MGVLPILFIVRVLRVRRVPGRAMSPGVGLQLAKPLYLGSGRGCPLLRALSEHVFIARSASKKGTWPPPSPPLSGAGTILTEELQLLLCQLEPLR